MMNPNRGRFQSPNTFLKAIHRISKVYEYLAEKENPRVIDMDTLTAVEGQPSDYERKQRLTEREYAHLGLDREPSQSEMIDELYNVPPDVADLRHDDDESQRTYRRNLSRFVNRTALCLTALDGSDTESIPDDEIGSIEGDYNMHIYSSDDSALDSYTEVMNDEIGASLDDISPSRNLSQNSSRMNQSRQSLSVQSKEPVAGKSSPTSVNKKSDAGNSRTPLIHRMKTPLKDAKSGVSDIAVKSSGICETPKKPVKTPLKKQTSEISSPGFSANMSVNMVDTSTPLRHSGMTPSKRPVSPPSPSGSTSSSSTPSKKARMKTASESYLKQLPNSTKASTSLKTPMNSARRQTRMSISKPVDSSGRAKVSASPKSSTCDFKASVSTQTVKRYLNPESQHMSTKDHSLSDTVLDNGDHSASDAHQSTPLGYEKFSTYSSPARKNHALEASEQAEKSRPQPLEIYDHKASVKSDETSMLLQEKELHASLDSSVSECIEPSPSSDRNPITQQSDTTDVSDISDPFSEPNVGAASPVAAATSGQSSKHEALEYDSVHDSSARSLVIDLQKTTITEMQQSYEVVDDRVEKIKFRGRKADARSGSTKAETNSSNEEGQSEELKKSEKFGESKPRRSTRAHFKKHKACCC